MIPLKNLYFVGNYANIDKKIPSTLPFEERKNYLFLVASGMGKSEC